MADVIRKFGVQFVLENTKSVLNDADKFIAQMEKKTEKIDLTSEIKTEFEKLSDYLKNNFKNGLNLSSQFSNIINSKDVDEAIGKIEDLSDSLKLVNTILNYDGGVDESFKKMLGELNSQQLAEVFQVARNQKPRATHKTKQANLLKSISDTYTLGLKDKGSLGQTTEMSKELEGVLKNIGEDIKSIRQSVNNFEQKGIKSTLAGITSEMTAQGEAGQTLNDVFVGLANALKEYQEQGRKGLNMPESRSGETDVPKTPKEVEDDDPVTKELKKYGELDKTLASITDEHTFLDNFKSQAKDIASAIDKLRSMKISLEDIQKVYPRLVQGYRMWVAVQNQDSKNKIKGLYEQKLEQEKMFYRSSKEVDEGLLKSADVKQSQEEYQAKSVSFDNQINEEFTNAIKQGILTQEEVDRIKLEYGRKLKEATDAIDREVKEKAINSRLSEEEKEKRRKQEEERKRIAEEAKRAAEKERLREERQRQEAASKKSEAPINNPENDLKLNRLKEMVSKENELFNKKDLKSYQEYMNSIREESLQLQKELSELNILPNDRQTSTFLKSQGNREAILIDNALKAKQKEIEKVKNNPEEFKKQYQEAAEFILEAQKRLEELEANGSKIAKNKIKDNELFLNKENYFKKMIPNPNQEEIDYSIKELKRLEEELRTPIKGEFDPDKRTDYEQAYKNRIDLIKEYREQLKQLGATEEEMSILKHNALDKNYWIDILKQKREARRKERDGQTREDELDTFEASNDLARSLSGQDYNASRAVEDESIKGQSKYGDEISELSEEAEKIGQLTNIIKEYRSQMDETTDITQKIQIYNELQSKIEEIKTEYQELYTTMQENDEDMTQILSWNDIESNYVPKKQEIENLKQQLEDSKKAPAPKADTSGIDAQTDAIGKNTEAKEKSNEVSNNTDNSAENSQRQEITNIIDQQTEALDRNTEASERNQQQAKGNVIITTSNSQSQPNSFTMPDDAVVTTGNNEQITNSAETIRENIGKEVTKSNAKYEIDVTDIIKIKTDGLKGIALKIATDLNTAIGKYSKLTGLVPVNEEAVAEVEEYKIAQEQIKNFPNIIKDMKFNNIFAKDKKGNLIRDGKIRKISFDSLSQIPQAQQQMIFEDKIVSLYDEALNLSERINSGKGNKAQIEKAKEKLSVLKEQMVALLSMFTEIGSMFSHQEIIGDKTVSIYVDPLEHLKNNFSDKTRRTHTDITDEEMTSFVKDFTQWLQPFIEEKNAIWDVGNNIKAEGKKIVDKNGRPIKVFDASARSNYNQARNLGETIQKYFDNSSMFNKNGNLQLTFEELQQISNLLPKSPKDNKYLKESVNPQEVFTKIQQIIANAIQKNIDALSAQLENGEDVELPLKASRTALAQLYKSMGISIEKPKPVVAPVIQPVSTSQQPPSAPTVQQPTDNVGQIASETSKRLIEEGENAKVVGINFQDAALAKQVFTEANKEAKVSAEETAVAIAEETNEAGQVANEFDLVAEKTREAVAKITSGNQKSLTPIEVLRNSVNLAEQIERVTNGKLPSAQGLGEGFYKSQSEKYHRTIDEMDFNSILTLSSSLEVQTDSLLKLLSQVGVIGSDGFNQLATSIKVVEQAIVSTDNEVNTLYKTFNNTKIKGISKLSETQLMDKADNSLLEMERLYNENKQETNEYLLEQLKVKQVLDEMIKRSGGRSGLGVDNDFDAYKSILNNWIENNGLVSGKKGASLFSHDIKNIGDETGKAYGAKKAIEKWVRPMDYEDAVLISQQFGIILDYINQNQEALKLVHDQLQANLPIIEETADEMKEVTENAEQAAEAVDKVANKTETPVQEEVKPSPVVTTDNSQKTNNKFAQLSDKEILDKYKKNQEYEDAFKYFYTEEEILSGRASSHKADYIKLKEENAELEKIIKERGLLNEELKEEITETKEIIKEDTASQDKAPVEKEKPKNSTEEKWEKVKKKFGIETPDYSKLSDKEILAEYGKMSGKMNAQKHFINKNNKDIDISQMTDEQLLSDSVEILGKEKFIEFRRNTEELKRLIEERKIVIGEQKQVVEETKEQLKKDEEASSSAPSSVHTAPIVHPIDVMPTFDIEDFSKKTDDEIKALSRKKKNELADVVHLNLAQRIDLSSMTDEEILANPNVKNKNAYFQLREENKELDRIIKERKSLEEEKKKVDAEINQPQKKDESQKAQEKPTEEKPVEKPKESPVQQELPIVEQHTESLEKASESANRLEQNLDGVAESLGEIEQKEEQLGQTITKAETSAQPLSPEQTASTTSELEETKNKVIELERQIANLQNQAQKFDFGDKAIETLKEFEKILKTISESLKDIDAKWKGIYATNASNFKKVVAEESQKSDIKSNSPTKTTNDIIKDQLKSDLTALTNKSSKTGIYGRDSLHIKDRANKLSDPKDIDNLEKADALFDKIAKRIQNLKKTKSLSGILDDPEIKALLEERRKQINYVSRSKLKKNANENNLRQNRNVSKLEQAYKSATELAPEAYRIEDLIVNGTASDKDLKKFNDFVRAKSYIESEEGQKVQSLIDSNVIKNYQTAISFSEQRQEALRKEREELEKKAEAEKRVQEYEALKARMDKAELDDEWDAKHSIERYNQQRKKEDAKRTAELWARMDADEESKNQDYKQSQENYKKQLAYSEKVRQEREAQEQRDIEAIVKAYDTMTTKARTYYELRDRQESGEDLTAKEKDRLEQLEKEYQEATNTLIEYGKNKTELWDKEPVMNAEQAFLDKNMLVNEELNAKRQEKDIQTIINAYNLLSDKMRQYYALKEKEATGEISNSEKDKLEQLEKQYQSTLAVLIDFAREKEALWQDNRIIEAEQGFLNKEKQVKGEQVDKQTRQQNLETQAKEIQDRKDGQELINTYKQLYDVYYKYQQLKEKQNNTKTPLSSAELKQIQDLEAELDKLNSKLLEFANNKPELWNQKNVVDAEETFKNNILNIDSIGNGDKVKQIVNAYDKRFSAEDKIRSLTVQQASNYNANRAKQIADLEAKVKEYTQIINENTKAIMDNNDAIALNIVNNAEQQYNQKTESSTDVLNESINTDRINKAKSTLASLEELRSEYSSGDYTNQQELLDAVETRINNINQLIKDLNTNPLDLTTKEDLDELSQIDKELSNYKKDIADIKKDSKDYQTANGSKTARSIAEFISKNSGISQEAKDALQQYINLIDKGVNVGQLREIGAAFEDIKRQEIEAGRTGTTFFDMLGQRVKGLTATLMTYVSFWRVFSELKQGFQIIRQFDDALAEMQKVSNETLGTLKEFQTTTFDLADSIGSDALALQQSVAEFMRLGQSLEEATDSAKSANILLNVSEFTSASEASEALIAMSQAYQDLSNIEIIDVINKLGNDFPISTQGLATALQDGAASLTTAGNSFYEAAALVTAGNRITQDPSKVGKAMRTIALRLTGTEASKAELEEDGEEVEGMITNVSKLRDVIMQATKVGKNGFKGFDILKDNGAYKSTFEILLGISDIYQDIVENDEKYGTKGANLLLETIAGKNRASIAASILQSPDMLKKAYAEALDAEGSAEIENAKFIDSISGHLEKLKNAWQEVWANTLNRDVINFFLDLGTAILKVVSNIGLLPSLAIFGGGIATLYEFAKGTGLIVDGLKALNNTLIGNTNIVEENTAETERNIIAQTQKTNATTEDTAVNGAHEVSELTATELLDAETNANIENVGSQVAETTADAADTAQTMEQAAATEANVAAIKQETAENLRNAASQGVKEGSKKTSIGANLATNFNLLKETASNAFTAIGGIKGLLGGGLIIGGIVAAIQAYDALNISVSETAKEAKEISSAFEESLGTIQEHKDTINELSESYQNLSQGVNTSTNTNLTLSNDEYKEYLDTCNKIAEIYPQLITGYDLQGNAIINLTDNVKDLQKALIEEQKTAADTFLNGGEKKGISGFFDNIFGFFGLGNKNSIKDNFNKNYDKYQDIQEIQDYFLKQGNVTLSDYDVFRTDLLGKSLEGDINATNLLNTLDGISNGLIDSDEKLNIFLKDLSNMEMPKQMQESMQQAQQTLFSNLSKNDTYWDLIYNKNEEISKNASNLFTNAINKLPLEKYSELFSQKDGMKNYANALADSINSALTGANSNEFLKVLDSIEKYTTGNGVLASANMGDFIKLTNSYKQAFIDAFADSEDIDGAQFFETIFDDKGVSELTDRFNQVLDNASFIQNDADRQKALDYFNSLGQEEARMYTESFKDATSFEDVDRKFGSFQRSLAAKTHEAIINIEDETAAINTLKSAISSSNGDTGLSSEEITNLETLFKDLMDEDGNPLYSAPELFENTANGIRLNQKQLKKLNNEYKREKIAEATDKLDYYQKALIETQNEIDRLRGIEGKEADLSAEEQNRNNILQNIDALQREITQYEGLTSAYNEYVNALSTTNGNAGYDTIQSGYDTVKDLIDRGWGGADEVRQYVQMFTAEDVSTWSVEQLIERFNELDDAINSAGYSYKDFFTVDENGKTTSDGVFNFLDALKQEAKDSGDYSDAVINQLVSVEKKYSEATGKMEDFYSFDFDAIGGDQAVADLMNMDISTLHKWLEAAEAAGFDVVWTDYAHKVANATKTIKQAREALEEFKEVNAEDYKLNTSVDSVESVESELAKAQELIQEIQNDDTISPEVSTAKLDYVQAQLDSLIQTKLILEQPLLFNTNLADVEGDYQNLFLALQNYGMELQTVQTYGRMGLPVDTSQADQKLRGVLKALQGLDKETQKEFGIDFDLEDEDALEQLKEKLANEEITIPIKQVMGENFDYSKLSQGKDTIVKVRTVFDDNGAIQGLQLVDSLGNIIDGSYYTANINAKDNATGTINNTQEGLEDIDGTKVSAEIDVKDKQVSDSNKLKSTFQQGASSKWTINSNLQSFYRSFTDVKNDFIKSRSTTWTINKVTKNTTQSTGTAYRPVSGSGGGGKTFKLDYNGTAHALGTAYARGTSGNWGVTEDQDALTGELGEELVVRNGHFFTVGSESAEMVHLQKGDIVFNADQTKQIFEKGRILNGSRRGRAHVDGTAYSAGSGGRRRVNAVVASSKTTNNSSSSSNNKSSSNKSSNNKEAEKMDWIAIAIERIEQQIDELNDVVDSVYRSWSDRNQALAEEIKAVSDEIAIQQAGYKRYLKEAESVGLSAAYAKKVREGTIDIEKITDENLKKKIDEYQQWCVLRPLIW